MKKTLIALVAALATSPCGLAMAQTDKATDISAWVAANVEPRDWAFLTLSDDGAIYTKPNEHRAHGTHSIWSRSETRGSGMSQIALSEYDCVGHDRYVTATSYSKNNMGGIPTTESGVGKWQYIIPGSVGEQLEEAACEPSLLDAIGPHKKAKAKSSGTR